MNTDILEISEIKWTGMGEFNSDDHFIYQYLLLSTTTTVVKNLLEDMEQSTKESKIQYLGAASKMIE